MEDRPETGITRPRTSIEATPYWQGCREGKLLFQRCAACGEVVFHPRGLCPYCLSDQLVWEQSAGNGSIYSYSVQQVPLHRERPWPGQRIMALIALDEGFHMFSEVLGDPDKVAIGDRVRVRFDRLDETLTLPKFEIAP